MLPPFLEVVLVAPIFAEESSSQQPDFGAYAVSETMLCL